jgi:hypothetical protein
MVLLRNAILRFFSLNPTKTQTIPPARTSDGEAILRGDWRFEEALMASMYDEGARMYLDHYSLIHHGGRHFG